MSKYSEWESLSGPFRYVKSLTVDLKEIDENVGDN